MIRDYFNSIADKIAAMSQLAGATAHNPDIGQNREVLLRDVLNNHLPQRMQAVLGGNVLGFDGSISKQIDIIVRADNTPRFEENQKTFTIAESLVAAISVKSTLNKAELFDSLDNLASVPQLSKDILQFNILKPDAADDFIKKHPTNYIYAFDGIKLETLMAHLMEYAESRPDIPGNRVPHYIVVHGKYALKYTQKAAETYDGTKIPEQSLYPMLIPHEMRGHPLCSIISYIYTYTSFMPYLDVNYYKYINNAFNPTKT